MSCNRCATQVAEQMTSAGVPHNQTMATFSQPESAASWELLPRCPHCKKWVSPRSGICNYRHCNSNGDQVRPIMDWPPQGYSVLPGGAATAARTENRKSNVQSSLHNLALRSGMTEDELEQVRSNARQLSLDVGNRRYQTSENLQDYSNTHLATMLPGYEVAKQTTREERIYYSELVNKMRQLAIERLSDDMGDFRGTNVSIQSWAGDVQEYSATRRRTEDVNVNFRFGGGARINSFDTTAQSCSCPDHTYRRRECRHMRAMSNVAGEDEQVRNFLLHGVIPPDNNDQDDWEYYEETTRATNETSSTVTPPSESRTNQQLSPQLDASQSMAVQTFPQYMEQMSGRGVVSNSATALPNGYRFETTENLLGGVSGVREMIVENGIVKAKHNGTVTNTWDVNQFNRQYGALRNRQSSIPVSETPIGRVESPLQPLNAIPSAETTAREYVNQHVSSIAGNGLSTITDNGAEIQTDDGVVEVSVDDNNVVTTLNGNEIGRQDTQTFVDEQREAAYRRYSQEYQATHDALSADNRVAWSQWVSGAGNELTEERYDELMSLAGNMTRNDFVFQPTTSLNNSVTFGTEIEWQGENTRRNVNNRMRQEGLLAKGWEVVYDCTCSGGEAVTPVYTNTEEAWNDINRVNEIIDEEGGFISHQNGGHVHIGTGNIQGDRVEFHKNLAKLFSGYQNIIYRLASNNRGVHRSNRSGRNWGGTLPQSVLNNITSASSMSRMEDAIPAKRYGIDYSRADYSQGSQTVEFRVWDGTLDARRNQMAIQVSAAMVKFAEKITVDPSLAHKIPDFDSPDTDENFRQFLGMFDDPQLQLQVAHTYKDRNQFQAGSQSRNRLSRTQHEF